MASPLPKVPERPQVLIAFGQAVRHFRRAQGFSQEAFAHYCDLDRSYMGGVERGERNIALVNVEKIIHALGLQPSEFFRALDQTQHTDAAPKTISSNRGGASKNDIGSAQ